MNEETQRTSDKERDRFYVQKDKHPIFQRLAQSDQAPFKTMKDAWMLAVAVGVRAGARQPMRGGTQHVGFWHYLTTQEDIPLLQAIAIAETGDVAVLGDRGEVIRIAEEYANGGIDLLLESERSSKEAFLRALAGAVLKGSSAETQTDEAHARSRVFDAVRAGEGATVEFKESARWNTRADRQDAEMELVVVRTVAGFANSAQGGTLLIGVADDGKVRGIAKDYTTLGRRQNRDGFENWLTNFLEVKLGSAALTGVGVTFETAGGVDVCILDVRPSSRPVFIDGDPYLYVRTGNSTRKFDGTELLAYSKDRFSS